MKRYREYPRFGREGHKIGSKPGTIAGQGTGRGVDGKIKERESVEREIVHVHTS